MLYGMVASNVNYTKKPITAQWLWADNYYVTYLPLVRLRLGANRVYVKGGTESCETTSAQLRHSTTALNLLQLHQSTQGFTEFK